MPWKVYPTISPSICFGSRMNPGDYRLRVKASTAKYLCTVKFFHHFDLSFRITVKQPPSLLLANAVLQRSLGRTAIFPFEQSHENLVIQKQLAWTLWFYVNEPNSILQSNCNINPDTCALVPIHSCHSRVRRPSSNLNATQQKSKQDSS